MLFRSGLSVPFVGTDNVTAAYKATEYLFSNGHTNICFMSPPPKNTSAIEERIEGHLKYYSEQKTAVNNDLWLTDIQSTIPDQNTKSNIEKDIIRIKEHLENNRSITAILAVEYQIALLASRAIQSIGKSIPEDFSVVCFDAPRTLLPDPFFTSIHQKEYEIGNRAFVMLLDFILNNENEEKVFLDTELDNGSSVRSILPR